MMIYANQIKQNLHVKNVLKNTLLVEKRLRALEMFVTFIHVDASTSKENRSVLSWKK